MNHAGDSVAQDIGTQPGSLAAPTEPPPHPLRDILARIREKQVGAAVYQPIFGQEAAADSQRPTLDRCEQILAALRHHHLRNLDIVDVGSNLGYVAIFLSQFSGSVTGVELDPDHVAASRIIAEQVNSSADFVEDDFFAHWRRYAGRTDVLLLLSVMHYMVANHGMAATRHWLTEAVQHFDVILCELSSQAEYDYMPEDALELLSDLPGVRACVVGITEKGNRPLVMLQSSETRVTGTPESFDQALYLSQPGYRAKVYLSERAATKVIKLHAVEGQSKFVREVAALKTLADLDFVPTLHGYDIDPGLAWIRMSRVPGHPLTHYFTDNPICGRTLESPEDSETVAAQLILALDAMLRRGVHWNDLSLHNIMVAHGMPVHFVDFGESGPVPTADPSAMMSWLLLDLHEMAPISLDLRPWAAGPDAMRMPSLTGPRGLYAPVLDLIASSISVSHDFAEAIHQLAQRQEILCRRNLGVRTKSTGLLA